ncbi:MAG TPA: glycosyltransferase [Dokdonella sp.]|uniref:glycosyltransferase n=1 Tax=Dokdonella sp. TaxID=2291710 RepID=UPI002D7F277F|nr:glycosyltransferase [Dokdonella sp.]HET9032965.1 glycosyltransferase [Dokdonella sp.]
MRGAALIILAWNQWELTRRCLHGLLAQTLDEAEIIVVDNGSEDDTPTALQAYADRVRLVRLPENLGFVRGMNAGIAAARPDDDVVLLNNDLIFTQDDWLARLRDAAYAAADHGIVGCRMLGPEPGQRLFHLGGFIEPESLWGQQTESGQQEIDVGQFPGTRRVQGIAFALAYIRRDCLDRIGGLDEIFHSYFEDTDYCLRAADAGIASVLAGAVTLRHDQHGSTKDDGGFRERLWKDSREKFAGRWQQRLINRYRGNVLWQGLSRSPLAYAQLSHDLLWRLDARELRMAYSAAVPELLDDGDFRLSLASRRTFPAVPEVALVCAPGQSQIPARGRHRVGLVFSEWQQPPPTWAGYYNDFDLLLAPDTFQAEGLRAIGVRTPIEIFPLGVDREYCYPQLAATIRPGQEFVFMSVVESIDRDAPELIVEAFQRSFRIDEGVVLIIYIQPGNDENAIRKRLEILLAKHRGASVRIIYGWGFPVSERTLLFSSADAYVSARRGGGWDPLVRSASACGRIVIAPAFGSQQQLIREHGLSVDLRGTIEDPSEPGCWWADPDPDALAWRIRDVFKRRDELASAARSQRRDLDENDLDRSADRLVEMLERGNTLRAPRVLAAPHQPRLLARPPSGQIVVLGMHRSGTSSVGGLLKLFGAWPGADELLLRGADNPRGHFEHGEIHMACLRRLQAAGGDWKSPVLDSPAAAIDAFRREIAAVLETLEPKRPWFIKEPRLCLLVRELLPLLTRPLFIHVVRDPREVAASLQRRDGMSAEQALALWELYTNEAFGGSAGWNRILVDYNALIDDPVATANAFYDALESEGIQGLTRPDAASIVEWIDAAGTTTDLDRFPLTPSQQTLLDNIGNGSICG